MTYFLAAVSGVAGAVLGWLTAGFGALLIGGFEGMSDFEGERAVFSFLVVGPVGGIIGLILGVVLVFRYRGKQKGFGAVTGRGLMVIGAIGALAILGAFIRLYSLPNLSHPLPRVVFEIRLPPDAKVADKQAVRITLDTDKSQTDALLDSKWLTQEAGRPVLHGFVDLYKRTTNRLLVLKIAGEPDRLFPIKLWGNPGPFETFTPWEQVEYIADGGGQLRRAAEEDKYEFRFRVERETDKGLPLQGNATGLGLTK